MQHIKGYDENFFSYQANVIFVTKRKVQANCKLP